MSGDTGPPEQSWGALQKENISLSMIKPNGKKTLKNISNSISGPVIASGQCLWQSITTAELMAVRSCVWKYNALGSLTDEIYYS